MGSASGPAAEHVMTVRRSPRAVHRRLSGEEGAVVLHLDSAAYHGLNEVGSLIWELIGEEGATMQTLVTELRVRVNDPPDDLADHVHAFLSALAERNLVLISGDR